MTTLIEQRSPEWYAARCGSLGASDLGDALTRTKTGWGATREAVMTRLLIERLMGQTIQSFVTRAMQEGIDREPEARRAYCFFRDIDVAEAGLYRHPDIDGTHASPDGLIGDVGLVEIKCPQPPAHLKVLRSGGAPQHYMAQVQWQLACTGREWCDFVSYQPQFPAAMQLVVRRIERDDRLIGELARQVLEFLEELESQHRALVTAYDPMRSFEEAHALIAAE
jgi:putative phage-type endonuclease